MESKILLSFFKKLIYKKILHTKKSILKSIFSFPYIIDVSYALIAFNKNSATLLVS